MTALAGLWNFDGNANTGENCRRMLAAQRIYGPDGTATWHEGAVALGRSLFALLPEDRYDRGPIVGGDGRFVLVADVRLDNRDELAKALAIAPDEALRMPDAAFVMRAWEAWAERSFARLYGDFAFALWDNAEHRLFLVRDPLGGRPLHYHQGNSFLAFSSMPKGLHALPDIPYAPDEEHTAEFLALLPETGAATFFEGISRVEPGHASLFTTSGHVARRYWAPAADMVGTWRGSDPVEAMREHLDRSVRVRLRGCDGRVAAHLSGGLDSSAVASTAARLLAPSGGEVVAFTSVPREGFDGALPPGRIGDEGPLASATAALYPNMRHRLIRTQGSVLDGWERNFHLLERPVFNSFNQQWHDQINAAAQREGMSVVLTGALGNATLSYNGMERLPELAAGGRYWTLAREARALVRAGALSWRSAIVHAFGHHVPDQVWKFADRARGRAEEGFADHSSIHPERIRTLALSRKARERGLIRSQCGLKGSVEVRLWNLLRYDLGNYQKAGLGGWGVDLRDPTTDRRLIEFCLSLPTETFLANGELRLLAKQALADRLPPAVIDEPRRGYQAADWYEGAMAARDGIRDEVHRLSNVPAAALTIDLEQIRSLVDNWPSDFRNAPEFASRYRIQLMRGAASGHFLRKASRSNA